MASAPEDHALFSASGGGCWMNCPAALALQSEAQEEGDSEYAREGTAAHELANWTLASAPHRTIAYHGRVTGNGWEVTEDMCEHVQTYVDDILARVESYKLRGAIYVHLLLEQKLYYAEEIGVARDQGFGTGDVVIIAVWPDHTLTLDINDLKFGRGVRVSAIKNEQLRLYAIGARSQYEMLGDFKDIVMAIHQPRLDAVSEWSVTNDELSAFASDAGIAAGKALTAIEYHAKGLDISGFLKPGEKQCRWCKAKGYCPAVREKVRVAILGDFEEFREEAITEAKAEVKTFDNEALGGLMGMLDMIVEWTKAVRTYGESKIHRGENIPGWKLVQGKAGNRKWADETAVEDSLRRSKLPVDDIYDRTVISPTSAEKLLKKTHPRIWKSLQAHITKAPGQPTIAEVNDPRPALVLSVKNDFGPEDIEDEELC